MTLWGKAAQDILERMCEVDARVRQRLEAELRLRERLAVTDDWRPERKDGR